MIDKYMNQIVQGDALSVLKTMPNESVSCVVTSPPYWALRDYGTNSQIWDGDIECKHSFNVETKAGDIRFRGSGSNVGNWENPEIYKGDEKGNFCSKCNAWKGELGLEPTFDLYIKHLCDIFDEIKRVLRPDGTCWVNLGDTYSSQSSYGDRAGFGKEIDKMKNVKQRFDKRNYGGLGEKQTDTRISGRGRGAAVPEKSLCQIPQRFSIEMCNRGWILRNVIIWHKRNCMPSSIKDRFTVDFEYVYFFVKNNKTLHWVNEKTLQSVDTQPLGTKGVEGQDWEWKKVGAYTGGTFNVRVRDGDKNKFLQGATESEKQNYLKGKMKKVSLWSGRDYWFEQQFDEAIEEKGRVKNLATPKTFGGNSQIGGPANREGREWIATGNRNKRCVWQIATQPYPEAHFATFPEELVVTPIKSGCPEFICKKCGKAREKILEPSPEYAKLLENNRKKGLNKKDWFPRKKINLPAGRKSGEEIRTTADYRFKGYTDCKCNAGFEGGITLDPFAGSGTTCLVANKLGRRYIGIELKLDYKKLGDKRIEREGNVLGI